MPERKGRRFIEARDHCGRVHIVVAFFRDLHVVRNARDHAGLRFVGGERVAFLNRGRQRLELSFCEIIDAAFRDIMTGGFWWLAHEFAKVRVLDERGHFDPAWQRVYDALPTGPQGMLEMGTE